MSLYRIIGQWNILNRPAQQRSLFQSLFLLLSIYICIRFIVFFILNEKFFIQVTTN